jgi:5'-nucleotidase
MRNDADLLMPTKVEGVDLILGGHDHVVLHEIVNGTAVIKSGTNFNNVGLIKLFDKKYKTDK